MATSLVPEWAPNLHPLVVHFPIALLITAAAVDVVHAAVWRAGGLGTMATALYGIGAISALVAFLTGRAAAATVFIPDPARAVVQDHWNLALATTIYFGAIAALRIWAVRVGLDATGTARALFLVVGLFGVVLLQQTAERGARLVYEHGVGVVVPPRSR